MRSRRPESIAIALLMGLCATGAHATSPSGSWSITVTNHSTGQLPYLLTATIDDGGNLNTVNWDYNHFACLSNPAASSTTVAPNTSSPPTSIPIGTGCDIDTGNVYYYNFLLATRTITLVTSKNSPSSVNMKVYSDGKEICGIQIGDHSDDYAAVTLTAGTSGEITCTASSES